MRVLAFDPGQHVGYAVLDLEDRADRPTYVTGGTVEADRVGVWLVGTKDDPSPPDFVAIETVNAKAHHVRAGGRKVDISKELSACEGVAGVLRGLAIAAEFEIVRYPATQWRRVFCGTANPDDARVKRACELLVAGLPAKTNPHLRDAVGLGWYALRIRSLTRRTG